MSKEDESGYIICEECGYTMDNRKSGFYYCPKCEKDQKFYSFTFGCGSKPNKELYGHIYDKHED